MYVIDDTQPIFFDEVSRALTGRGVSSLPLSNYEPSKLVKPNAIFISEASKNLNLKSDTKLIDFFKTNKFKKAFFLQWNCSSLEIENYYNSAINIFKAPCADNFREVMTTFFLHRFFELVLHEAPNLPCASETSMKLMQLIKKIAPTDATVLISGPTGTGKEVLSNLVHNYSNRQESPFVALNCAAIPEQMLESILFGHEKGAFTGALQANQGLVRAASGGTLLLDEISEMPLTLQSKLLRVIQEKKVMPIGSSVEIDVDVRIIATTNRNMVNEVKAGNFREDLFYRLNVFPIDNESLERRIEDVVPIVAHLLSKPFFQKQEIYSISQDAVLALMKHNWPGNVRELDNLIQRALILCEAKTINLDDLIFDGDGSSSGPNTAEVLASKLKSTEASEVL